jgi:hypothetical protein
MAHYSLCWVRVDEAYSTSLPSHFLYTYMYIFMGLRYITRFTDQLHIVKPILSPLFVVN